MVVYYGSDLPITELPLIQYCIRSGHQPELNLLLEQRKTVLGYISLGEINQNRSYFKQAQQRGTIIRKKSNWPEKLFCGSSQKILDQRSH